MRGVLGHDPPSMRLLTNNPRDIERFVREPTDQPVRLAEYTVAALPSAALWRSGLVNVSNETGGYVTAFSDGTNWRRVTDRAVVS